MRQLICIVTICYLYTYPHLNFSKEEEIYNLYSAENRHQYSFQVNNNLSDSSNSFSNYVTKDQKNKSDVIGTFPKLRESKESKQSRSNNSNSKGYSHKSTQQRQNQPEQSKNIYSLVDKLKQILECKKTDRMKKVKDCLDILDDYAVTNDFKEYAESLDQNTDYLNGNSEYEEYDEQNNIEDYLNYKRQYHNNKRYHVNKLYKKLHNQSHTTIPQNHYINSYLNYQKYLEYQDQNKDNEDKEINKDSDQSKNIYLLIDEKLKKIQECKKKMKSKTSQVKRHSKHGSDLTEIDSECLDILDFDNYAVTDNNQDNADNLDKSNEDLNINKTQYLYDLIPKEAVKHTDETEFIPTPPLNPIQKLEFVIPKGFEQNAKLVVTGVFSTAVIDNNGQLKFWFNRRNDLAEGVRTFQGYSKGKMSLSKRYFCAINDARELSCYKVNTKQYKPTLQKLHIPRFLTKNINDVSTGHEQICAVSAKSAVTCWTYTPKGKQILYVPHRIRKEDSALRVHSSEHKNCAIGTDAKLTCWGSVEGKNYKEQFDDIVKQMSMGKDYFCYIKINPNPDVIDRAGQLECYNTVRGYKIGVPDGLKKDVKYVSVGQRQICAIKRYGQAQCWNYYQDVSLMPLEVLNTQIVDISAGQQHICAINNDSKLSCWPVDY